MSLAATISSPYAVPPVERAFKVLRSDRIRRRNAEHRPERATASASAAQPSSACSRRLRPSAWSSARATGVGFRLGVGLAGLAAQALSSSDIVESADPMLASLADTLGLSAHLGVLEGRDVLYVARRTPNLHLISNVRIGSRLPAHATTMGRIILAYTASEMTCRGYSLASE